MIIPSLGTPAMNTKINSMVEMNSTLRGSLVERLQRGEHKYWRDARIKKGEII